MKTLSCLLGTLALVAANAFAADLFKGRDFSGWELVTAPGAKPADSFSFGPDGVISSTGTPVGFIATTSSYSNYHLHAEWRWTGKPGNGGVLLHISPGTFDRAWPLSLQVQTKFGNAGDLLPMAGATFAEALMPGPGAPARARNAADSERPAGEWNRVDIVCKDGTVEVSVNGVAQNRVSQAAPSSGRIGFQLEGAPYQLREVILTPIE